MIKKLLPAVFATILLAGCATPLRLTLTPEQRSKISELKAHVVVVQDEVLAAVHPSQVSLALGGGLIPAMIDSSITNARVKESQKLLGPFYAIIEDVDYRKEFNEKIRAALQKYAFKTGEITNSPRILNSSEIEQMTEKLAPGQALLIIAPRYFLSMDFRNLDSETWVTIWMKSEDKIPLHRGVVYYQSKVTGPGGRASIDLWSEKNAAPFRKAIDESIAETIDLILLDINLNRSQDEKEGLEQFNFSTGAGTSTLQGKKLKEAKDRVHLIGADGKLYSLPKE